MKKVLLLVAAIALLGSAKAQSDLVFGVKGGLNATNITNSEGDNKVSFHLGGFAEMKLNDFVGLQAELLYSRQGYRDKWKELGKTIKFKGRVNYLNIPVLAKLYVWDKLSLDLGPQLGFALNAKGKAKMGDTTVKSKLHDLNTVDLSFVVGASYEFECGLSASARYNIGLTNVFDKDVVGESNKNHVFMMSVGYNLAQLF